MFALKFSISTSALSRKLTRSMRSKCAAGAPAVASGLLVMASACTHSDEPAPAPDTRATSILLYAVASNNLAYDYADDLEELLQGMKSTDPAQADIWVYSLTNRIAPALQRVVRNADGSASLETVKLYTRDTFSTDPARISEVIADYTSLSAADQRGIIFWSHATGWQPDFSTHTVPSEASRPATGSDHDMTVSYSYGADQYLGVTDSCDILELDNAIPAATFDFIWFDCCYMSSIEVLYQLRDKAPYIVAYPTEVAAEGMPYDLTIPYLARRDFDLTGAARAMTDYYLDRNQVITIAVCRTAGLDALAVEAEKAIGGTRPAMIQLQRYSRAPNGPFFDFGQYSRTWGESRTDGDWDTAAFTEALDDVVVYKAASARGFDGRAIDPENFSGISCHYFEDYEMPADDYYKQLDWYKAVYPRYVQQ